MSEQASSTETGDVPGGRLILTPECRVAPDSAPDSAPKAETESADEIHEADEDRLRKMVGELIREELRGALGERITGNIRKLVRSQVRDALAERDIG